MIPNIQKQKLSDYLISIFTPREKLKISDWAITNVKLPSETAEPGPYSWKRAPYQKGVLDAISPTSPAREIVLVFGSQCGKTLIEMIAMLYYIKNPRAQGFTFADETRLKSFIKEKFDPMLRANPEIESLLGVGSRTSGNTLTEKIYRGGFLHLASGSNANDLMSWSAGVVFSDEIDRFKSNVGGEGDPIQLLKKRSNTFASSRKLVWSSTPINVDSKILGMLHRSTYRKYMMHCPHCNNLLAFEWEYMKMDTNSTNTIVTSCYIECPHCGEPIYETSKTSMMDPENGARWISTNEGASEEVEGFFLPTLYAPTGWLSWLNICQEYLDAENAIEGRVDKLTTFYNTVLCKQFKEAQHTPQPEALYERALESSYRRGKIPSWVAVITTGADVQKNRIEIEVKGWGKRGRNLLIDYIIIPLEGGEEIEDLGPAWSKYYEVIKKPWKREDGVVLTSLGNALDRSYKTDTINAICLQFCESTLYPVRGVSKNFDTLIPSRKEAHKTRGAYYLDVPVDQIKDRVYEMLMSKDNEDHSVGLYPEFPADLSLEYFEQLTAERKQYDSERGRYEWVKIRERNEALDTFTYNMAMYYYLGYYALTDEQWDMIFKKQEKTILQTRVAINRATAHNKRRNISSGIKL